MKSERFFGNLKFALLAQTISTLFSVLMYLLVPKIMGTDSYSYWQLFLLYTNYSGFFHLGLVDGIYLKIGGLSYKSLDKRLLGNQFRIMLLIHICLGLITVYVALHSNLASERMFVVLCFIIYAIFYCIQNYFGFIFQAVNQTKVYSITVIIEKGICFLGTIVFITLRITDFHFYLILALCSMILSIIYLILKGKQIYFSKFSITIEVFREIVDNIRIGSILMLSGIVSTLIIGSGRMIVDLYWGIEDFGKLSFSISMINMLLLFIRQISMVLFPALRQMNENEQNFLYKKMLDNLSLMLPFVYIAYIPMKIILCLWLPQYQESILYLSLLLPICLYDGKMQMIFNTYFKVLREERTLLCINAFSLMISIFLCFLSAIILKNICMVAVAIVIGIAIRSIISQIFFIIKLENSQKHKYGEIVFEALFAVAFMYISWNYNELIMLISMGFMYIIYIYSDRSKYILMKEDYKWIVNTFLSRNR